MVEKKSAIIPDWVEPAHPMVLEYRDLLVALYSRIRDKYQTAIDDAFDKVSKEIGFLVTTTLPVALEITADGKIKDIGLGAEHLKDTIFDRTFSPILKDIAGAGRKAGSSLAAGTYQVYFIWFNALKLRLRTDWIEPAHFRDYLRIRERFQGILRFDWVEPAHVALGEAFLSPVNPEVMEPAHLGPTPQPWREKVLIAVIDEVYPELQLMDRIIKLKDILRLKVRPEVVEPAHFRQFRRDLPREVLSEIQAVLERHGYK